MPINPLPVVAFDAASLGERPDRAVAAGRVRRIIRGVYTTDLRAPIERVVRANIWEILAHLVPDAVLVDRSAGPALFAGDTLFVCSTVRARDVELPGLRVSVRAGHPPFEDDPLWMAGSHKASVARALVENLAISRSRGGRIARTLSEDELAGWLAMLAQQHSAERLNRFRDRARELSEVLGAEDRFGVLDRLFATALGTAPAPRGGLLGAIGAGRGWDNARVARFADLAERLRTGDLDPQPPALPVAMPALVREQPFFEAYLSNFIEGTEFSVDEAVEIVYTRRTPSERPADAHDVASTYGLITDAREAARPPDSAEEFIAQLTQRHARLMAARPDKRPGEFKATANRHGGYEFVASALVLATLERGFALREQLTLPFARALFMLFLVSEVHPFDDGNGRLARLAMNTELSAAGQHRILIPLIIRNDYLGGLRRLSREGDPRLLARVLANAWRWSAQVDFSTVEGARSWLARTHALIDAVDAERGGKYLILPADLST